MDLGSVAVIALVSGIAGGAVGAALVGTVEGLLRQRTAHSDRGIRDARDQSRGEWRVSVGATPPATSPRQQLDPDARNVVTLARHEAIQSGNSHIGTEHFALALRQYSTPMLDKLWGKLAIDPEALRRRIEAAVPPSPTDALPTHLSTTPRVGKILWMANALAAERKRDQVSPELILMALAEEGDGVGAQVLASLGATSRRFREIVDGQAS